MKRGSVAKRAESEADKLWLDEAERRDAEMESGKVKGIPGQDVFARIESRHKHKK